MKAKSRAREASYGLNHGRRRLLVVALAFVAAAALACSSSTASPTSPAGRAPAAPALGAAATAPPAQSTSPDSVAARASLTAGEDSVPAVPQLNPSGPKVVAPGDYYQLLGRDRIRPVYSPIVVASDVAALGSDDLVIGVSIGGESRAYPIRPLRFLEMVNDELGGTPILVTW